MKDYNYETDIITTPDPLFHPGDKVKWNGFDNASEFLLTVESVAWHTLKRSWTYTLLYFLPKENENDGFDHRWDGSLAVSEAFEKELKLVSRQGKNKVC